MHLEAHMIERGLADWHPEQIELLLIENAGNLVGPASHHRGEAAKVVVLSASDGKPLRIPPLFLKSERWSSARQVFFPCAPLSSQSRRGTHARVIPEWRS